MLGIAVLLLPGCLPPSSPPSSPAGRLRVLIQDPVPGLDPRQAVHIRVASVARQVHCGLVRYDPPALMEGRVELAGGLANLWEESEDGKRFVFHLRSGWNFGDDDCFPGWKGREVEASDVVYSLKRWLSPPTPDPFWKVLRSLRGAKSFRASLQQAAGEGRKIPLDSLPLEGARAPDARTVILELQEPDPFFLLSLAGPAGWVVAREADERYQGDLSSHPGGIGPYRLAVLDPVSGIVLVANPGYPLLDSRGRRLPLNGGVRYRYGDPITALLGPRHYDLVYSRAGTYRRLEGRLGNKGLVVGTTTKLNTIFFSFNFRSGTPWAGDSRLREALSLLLPRPESGPASLRAAGLLPPALAGEGSSEAFQPSSLPPQEEDPDRGREILARLREEGLEVPARLRLEIDPHETSDALLFARRLRPAGIRLEMGKRGSLTPDWVPDLFRDGWIADQPDPRDFFQLFFSGSPYNRSGFHNRDYDRIFLESLHAKGRGPLADLFHAMEKVLRSETPALWLRHERDELVARKALDGWEFGINPFMLPSLEWIFCDRGP